MANRCQTIIVINYDQFIDAYMRHYASQNMHHIFVVLVGWEILQI